MWLIHHVYIYMYIKMMIWFIETIIIRTSWCILIVIMMIRVNTVLRHRCGFRYKIYVRGRFAAREINCSAVVRCWPWHLALSPHSFDDPSYLLAQIHWEEGEVLHCPPFSVSLCRHRRYVWKIRVARMFSGIIVWLYLRSLIVRITSFQLLRTH